MESILSELSNPIRVNILRLLSEHGYKLTELAEDLHSFSNSEISRHLKRLNEKNLVYKDIQSGQEYRITPFGRSLIISLSNFLFLAENYSYFQDRFLDFLPLEIQSHLNSLQKAELIVGTGHVMHKIKELMELPLKNIKIMVDSRYPFLNVQAKISLIVPESMDTVENRDRAIFNIAQIKTLPETPISMAIYDSSSGLIAFRKNNENLVDLSQGFYVHDPMGIKFLELIWDFFWSKANGV